MPARAAGFVPRLLAAVDRNAFAIVVVGAALFELARHLSIQVAQDGWLTLVGGREVWHALPHHETLTIWPHGAQWIDQQWLAQLAFYGLYAAGGWKLALVVNTILLLAAVGLAMAAARSLGAPALRASIVAAACIPIVWFYWELRAQSFVYVAFIALVWLLVSDVRAPSRRVLLALPLLALWSNLHGSVVLAAALTSLRGLAGVVPEARMRRRLTATGWQNVALLIAAPVAIFASPYGFELAAYYHRTLFNPGLTHYISEWQPTSFDGTTATFFVVLGAALLLVGRSRTLTAYERLLVVGTGAAAVVSLRNVVWFGFAAMVVLPGALEEAWPERPVQRRVVVNRILAGGVAAIALATALATVARPFSWLQRQWPHAAEAAVTSAAGHNPHVRVYATLRYADWLLLEEPTLRGRIAYDARVELLSKSQLRDVALFVNAIEGWRAQTTGYTVFVLDPHEDARVETALLAEPGVRRVYRSREITVLTRGR